MGRLSVLQVNTHDGGGGAAQVVRRLHHGLKSRGHESFVVAGSSGEAHSPETLLIPGRRRPGAPTGMLGACARLLARHERSVRGAWRIRIWLEGLQEGLPGVRRALGIEDFDYPGTWDLLSLPPRAPQVVHLHNLHGEYFDLRFLAALSHLKPCIVTMHDAWLLSGHCAHSLECDRWQYGCGRCPHLTLPPAVLADATAFNWRRKKRIYARSLLHVTTPCQWLMDRVDRSMLHSADRRVIPYGVDLDVFQPGDRRAARADLGLAPDAPLLLFVAAGLTNNPWKDFRCLRDALSLLRARRGGQGLQLVALGDEPRGEASAEGIQFRPYESSPQAVAAYYRAADLYVHAARVDTFPNAVLEALACGTPVIASAVGGIPEQVRGLGGVLGPGSARNTAALGSATGLLCEPGDPAELARAISHLLDDNASRRALAANATRDAGQRFDIDTMVTRYEAWYQELVDDRCAA